MAEKPTRKAPSKEALARVSKWYKDTIVYKSLPTSEIIICYVYMSRDKPDDDEEGWYTKRFNVLDDVMRTDLAGLTPEQIELEMRKQPRIWDVADIFNSFQHREQPMLWERIDFPPLRGMKNDDTQEPQDTEDKKETEKEEENVNST